MDVIKFVCWCQCCWNIPSISSFLLLPTLFFSSSSFTTFVVASTVSPPTALTVSLKATQSLLFYPQLAVIVAVSLLLFAMGFLLKFLKRRKHTAATGRADEEKGKDGEQRGVRKFKWDEIKDLTKGFSRLIGQGGFSNVYLANLSGSNLGAVKILVGNDRLNQVFKQELDILTRIRHENIVKFLGYCDDQEEGAIVFEYISNGNLQEKLHGNEKNLLPWKTRTAIAFQLTAAIEYLHEKCSLQIVHGDIKASNILLDERFSCKLCDFGSAKMGFSSAVMPPSSRRKQIMVGSPGYTDPHYLRTGIASKKNDVYSLGVIILELVTGMEAFCPERGQLLTTMVAPKLRDIAKCGRAEETVAEMVDRRLGGEFDLEEAKALLLIVELCLHQSPTVRPSASQIMEMMKDKIGAVDSLFSPAKGCRC
ncbi:putative receptor-like protein kinase [Gossypium australe]|uniref:non-specific serine/threonine protein kinase n=1 Tax=Gossypium australe TaxID=47621 RepID=A0A5B6W3V8_9ROSI|nr:putative receptor-like protein kinase [Gossypium australe]